MDGNAIQYVSNYKYLGVIFDEFLSFEENSKNLTNSGSRALGSLMNKCRNLPEMSIDTYMTVLDTCVLPILNCPPSFVEGKGDLVLPSVRLSVCLSVVQFLL